MGDPVVQHAKCAVYHGLQSTSPNKKGCQSLGSLFHAPGFDAGIRRLT
jgi:hypothetical protein